MNRIDCAECGGVKREGGCSTCGGYGYVMSLVSLCSGCGLDGWVRPGCYTSYVGKVWRSIDGVKIVETDFGPRCSRCAETLGFAQNTVSPSHHLAERDGNE